MTTNAISSQPMRHALPMEVIRTVFETVAAQEKSEAAKLCRVCHTARYWVLPILYRSVVLASSAAIERFATSLASSAHDPMTEPKPSSLVRRLWIGPTSTVEQADLSYNSTCWPLPRVRAILGLCPSLHALAIMNVHQTSWPRLTLAIPRGVQALWIGPVHGKADWRYLPCAPSAREFLTMDTNMTEDELRQVVLSPSIRRIRRFFSNPVGLGALQQLKCVGEASGLEKLELVCCSDSVEAAAAALEEAQKAYRYDPIARVALTPRSHMFEGRYDPLALLHHDWLSAQES